MSITTREPPVSRARRKLGDWNTGDGRRPPPHQPGPAPAGAGDREAAARRLSGGDDAVDDALIGDRRIDESGIGDRRIDESGIDGGPQVGPGGGPAVTRGRRRLADGRGSTVDGPALGIDPRMAQRRAEVERARGRRKVHVAGAVGAVATLFVVALGVLHTGVLGARHIRLTGNGNLPGARVLGAAGIHSGEPLIDVDATSAAHRLDALATVATAEVQRRWPSTVRIAVTLRTPVAQIPTSASLTGPVVEIDSTGRILARTATAQTDLPLLVGVGTPGAVGSWIAGSAGAGQPLGSRATRPRPPAASVADATGTVRSALAFTAATEAAADEPGGLGRYHLARVDVAADGSISAIVTPGPVTVVLGDASSLPDKVTALVSMLRTQPLPAGSTLDLQVPDRPTVASTARTP